MKELNNTADNFKKSLDVYSDLEKKYKEEKEKLLKELNNENETSIELLKNKIYQKEYFYLFHEIEENIVKTEVIGERYSDLDFSLYEPENYHENMDLLKICGNNKQKYFIKNRFVDRKLIYPHHYYGFIYLEKYHLKEKKNDIYYKTLDYLIINRNILDKVKKYIKYYKGDYNHNRWPMLYMVGKECSSIIKERIEFFFKDMTKIIPSGWKIISKNNYFRIEPFGDKLTEIELPCGKSTIYMDGVFKKIEDVIQMKSGTGKKMKINNKGKVTQNNIKEVYEDCFKMIINRIISNKITEDKDEKNNNELIKYINRLENETEGWANKNSKKISIFLYELNKNDKISSLNKSNLNYITKLGLDKFKDEIDFFIQKELKEKNKKINPEFILLLDTSENMEDYAENFVRNIFYEVLLKLNFEMKQEIKIYTFNSVDTDKSILTLKKVKKFGCDCEGQINFTEAFKQVLEEITEMKNKNYYLLILLSGNIQDKELIRSIAFKSIGLSSKVFIK